MRARPRVRVRVRVRVRLRVRVRGRVRLRLRVRPTGAALGTHGGEQRAEGRRVQVHEGRAWLG